MNNTNANSSTASKEVKDLKMGFKVCGAIYREEPIIQKGKEGYRTAINDSEIVDYINNFESFIENGVKPCKITKGNDGKIKSVIAKTKSFERDGEGKLKATAKVAER